ncbi:delta-60 repeat domain-containing protein [Conexibacter woesei]|uniref:Bacterial repeat domain-containing protein n=1 Tax=Conexibacter woesei (strain DSM 14684 / CCUG 47730 / CIP 108061 / JCM 11494 / NBRC 100937 / ID131577) TaxID=469383 RepID=D3F9S7_CONWI|nr:delta-60 repeat domain-containing protein [Conexibacter woesei]ADB51139.1 hypothetical protein Cwoe_2720 [Conexibacter woesei DSM 14684]
MDPRVPSRGARRRVALTAVLAGGLLTALAAPAVAAPGDLDPSLSGDGRLVVATPGSFEQTNAVAVQPDGRIVVAGIAGHGDGSDLFVARVERDGTPDASFGGGDGVTTVDVAGFGDGARALALQPDGKIVVAGYGSAVSGLNQSDYAVARLTADGALDPGFGSGGTRTIDFGLGAEQARAVLVQPDGTIVVGGYANPSAGVIEFGLARLTADGALDPGFGSGGKRTTAFPGAGSNVHALALDRDGRIVAAGRTTGSDPDFALARYLPDGSLDTSFGGDGLTTTDFGSAALVDEADGVAIQADGKIVASGFTGGDVGDNRFAVARYDSDGGLDADFADGGRQTVAFAPGGDAQFPSAYGNGGAALQHDGSIVVAGVSSWFNEFFETRGVFALAALTPDGALDERFAPGGTVTTAFPAPEAEAHAIVLDPRSGALVVAGDARDSGESDTAIARYLGTPPPPRTVTVELSGDGSGSVRGRGIDCPGDCDETLPAGATVTLTATATEGSEFAGWGGACSGNGPCTVELTADVAVAARFARQAKDAPQPPVGPAPPGTPSTGATPTPRPTAACTRAERTLDGAARRLRDARVRVARAAGTVRRSRAAVTRARRALTRAAGEPARRRARANLRAADRRQRAATRTLTTARSAQRSAEQRHRDAARAVARRC